MTVDGMTQESLERLGQDLGELARTISGSFGIEAGSNLVLLFEDEWLVTLTWANGLGEALVKLERKPT